MRISVSEYINEIVCNSDLTQFRQCELTCHPDKLFAFLPEKYCFPGSYIKFRKDGNSPWSPVFRVGRISKSTNEIVIRKDKYYLIPDDTNITFVKAQICRTDSHGIIICEPIV